MKKYTLVLITLPLLAALVASTSPVRAFYPTELIKNGTFELGDNGDWQGSTDAITTSAPVAWHSGTQGVRMQENCDFPQCWRTITLTQTVVLPANAISLGLSFWYRHASENFSVKVVNADDPNEVFASFTLGGMDFTWHWTNQILDLTSHQGKKAKIEISGDIRSSGWYAYVDDVSLAADLLDTTAPTTVATVTPVTPNGENSFYITTPTVSLAATDDLGGSGVQLTSYRWDSAGYATYSSPLTAPEGTHTLSFYSQDVSGNSEAVKTLTLKVDTVKPTGTFSYSTTAATTGSVVATLVPSEPVTVTNNDGKLTRTFAANGSFTFTFKDSAGNVGSAKATVANISGPAVVGGPAGIAPATPGTPSAGGATAPESTVTAPSGQVLGVQVTFPKITTLKVVKGAYKLKVGKKSVVIRPFGKGYTGRVFGKRIDFSGRSAVLLFANAGPSAKGAIRLYSTKGALIGKTLPYGAYATQGLNADITIQTNRKVLLAVGWAAAGQKVAVYQVTSKNLKLVSTLQASTTRGGVLVNFLKLHKKNVDLVSMLKNQARTLKGWTYTAKNTYILDKTFKASMVKVAGERISLKGK